MSNPTVNAAPVISERDIARYRDREYRRFRDNTYTPLPRTWLSSWWFQYGVADGDAYSAKHDQLTKEAEARGESVWSVSMPFSTPYQDHFAHISIEDGGAVAFTENHAKGVADRQTRMKPGRYLKKYFGDVLTDEQIRDLATAFMAECAPATLKFAVTADEIEHVYTHGPSSCMAYAAGEYHGHMHPTRVYGDSDLQIAYFDRGDDAIKARAICWPAKKLYGRVYGDEARLVPLLREAGYAPGSMEGARIHAISNENDDGYIMPYVDGISGADLEGKWFVLRRHGEYDVQPTSGVTCDRRTPCAHCGNPMHEDDTHTIDDCDEYYCEACYCELTVECARTSNIIHRDNAVEMANGDYWSQRAFDRHGFNCPIMHENYPNDEGVEMADGDTWSQTAFDGSGFTCQGNGGNYDRAEMVVLADGALWSEEHFADYGHVNEEGDNVRNDDAPVDKLGYRCTETLEMPLHAPVAPAVVDPVVTVRAIDAAEYRVSWPRLDIEAHAPRRTALNFLLQAQADDATARALEVIAAELRCPLAD